MQSKGKLLIIPAFNNVFTDYLKTHAFPFLIRKYEYSIEFFIIINQSEIIENSLILVR